MSIKKTIALTAALLFLIQIQTSVSAQTFQKDATWVPESANVIAMVRMQKMLDSELGKKEGWRTKQYNSFKSGVATLPTSVESLLLAAQVDLEFLQPQWQVAVIRRKSGKIDLKKVKERAKSLVMDATFGSRKGLVMRSDAYLIQVADDTLVSMEPANRQVTSRWLKKHNPNKTTVSPYLQDAIRTANKNAHFIFAIDLDEAVDEQRIKIRLSNSPAAVKIPNIDAVSKSIASIRGVQMAITVTDKINGAFKLDFKGDMTAVIPHAKTLLLAILERNGYMVSDFEDWTMEKAPGAIMLRGTLSNEGFNQVASFVENPLSKGIERAIAGDQGGGNQEADMAKASQAYLTAVVDYLNELKTKTGSSLKYKAKFLDKYANQIDRQWSQAVDPIAIDFGGNVANALREMSSTLMQDEYARYNKQMSYSEQYENNAQASNNNQGGNYWANNYGGWGDGWGYQRYGKYTTEKVRDQKRINFGVQKEVEIKLDALKKDITRMYNTTRQELSKKYNTTFK